MEEIIHKILELKIELDSLTPMKGEDAERLWQKFRLDWNYNSNHIEGNTLSYGETALLIRMGDEFRAKNNSLKDVNEMKAHDVAIHKIRSYTVALNPEELDKIVEAYMNVLFNKIQKLFPA